MAETVISEAPAESTGAEDNQAQGPLSMEDLAASFVDQVESDQRASTDEAAEQTESSEDAEASVEEDVLSQSISEEETEQEDEEIEEEESEEEPPKAVGKLLKQVNKLTARAKSAEENAEALKAEIESLKSNSQPTEQSSGQPELENIQSFEDLRKLQKEAQAAKKFALQNIGRDYVEVDGKEYSDDDIRNILTQADEYLTEKIPARANYLNQKAQWQQDAAQSFPWLNKNDDSDYAEQSRALFQSIRSQEQYARVLDNLPNGDFVTGVLVKGIQSLQADKAAKTAPKKKAVAKPKTPPPTEGGNASPPVENASIRKQKQKEAIKRKGPLSASDLAAFLSD
jgi:hypothetical protein